MNTSTAITELINFPEPCGPAGKITHVMWGSFGIRPFLESDEGERLEIECVASGVNYYAMYYTGRDGRKLRVGMCPFVGGCNYAFFMHAGDAHPPWDQPDCFLLTSWTSKDYAGNDNPNPWTGQAESAAHPVLDHARSIYDVVGDNLTKADLKFEYATPPPIACPPKRAPEGKSLGVVSVDPPLGDETEAFFEDAANRLAALTGPQAAMSMDSTSPADLDGSGAVDDSDAAILNAALGKCVGSAGYDVRADFDLDKCVTFADQQIFEDLRRASADTTPPTLTVTATPETIWPPNHAMRAVEVAAQAADDKDPNPVVRLLAVTCDDGCVAAEDIAGAELGSDDRAFELRAERQGQGSGRTYTITYSATEASGNEATAVTTVVVPHDQGKGKGRN